MSCYCDPPKPLGLVWGKKPQHPFLVPKHRKGVGSNPKATMSKCQEKTPAVEPAHHRRRQRGLGRESRVPLFPAPRSGMAPQELEMGH